VAKKKFVFYNLRETYHELGEYEFKIVLDPKSFRNASLSEVSIKDSDGRGMKFSFEKWGRKINCKFLIDREVPDGVSTITMKLKDDAGHEYNGISRFWVIKP